MPDPCPYCQGTGWRSIMIHGYEGVEKCDHKPKQQTPDAKERAAGEERDGA